MTLQVPLLRREREEPPDDAPVPVPAPEAAQEAPAVPEPQAPAVIPHAFRTASRRAKDLAGREGGCVNGLLAGKPPSVNEQCDYLAQRRWLPPGHEGGIADKAGCWYHRLIGIPGVAFGNWISVTAARPFRLAWTLAVLAALALLIVTVT